MKEATQGVSSSIKQDQLWAEWAHRLYGSLMYQQPHVSAMKRLALHGQAPTSDMKAISNTPIPKWVHTETRCNMMRCVLTS